MMMKQTKATETAEKEMGMTEQEIEALIEEALELREENDRLKLELERICEEQPATTTAKYVDAYICEDCAATEPGTAGDR